MKPADYNTFLYKHYEISKNCFDLNTRAMKVAIFHAKHCYNDHYIGNAYNFNAFEIKY